MDHDGSVKMAGGWGDPKGGEDRGQGARSEMEERDKGEKDWLLFVSTDFTPKFFSCPARFNPLPVTLTGFTQYFGNPL